ncbi:MAG: hypothetical protein PHG65_10835, partial [Kiritimatiellae bacterium]|nr:hypothetical protein [Kiritimatiellia bacterium]
MQENLRNLRTTKSTTRAVFFATAAIGTAWPIRRSALPAEARRPPGNPVKGILFVSVGVILSENLFNVVRKLHSGRCMANRKTMRWSDRLISIAIAIFTKAGGKQTMVQSLMRKKSMDVDWAAGTPALVGVTRYGFLIPAMPAIRQQAVTNRTACRAFFKECGPAGGAGIRFIA